MNHDMNKELIPTSLEKETEVLVSNFFPSERAYLATTPQLTLEIVDAPLEHFMDLVNGTNAKGRKLIGMCCFHFDDLFITGTPRSGWRRSSELSSHNSRLDMKMCMTSCSQDNVSNGLLIRRSRRNFTL